MQALDRHIARRGLRLLTLAAVLLLGACADERINSGVEGGYGRILLRGAADGLVESRAEVDLATLGVTVPAPGEFALRLTCPEQAFDKQWSSVDAFNTEDELYKAGVYTATVSYGSPDDEGIDKPYFYGERTLTVVASETVAEEIPATLANSLAEVRTTAAFDSYFHDAVFTLTTASGNEFTFRPTAAQPATPVFVKAGTKLTLTGTARRQSQTGEDEGPSVTFSEQTLGSTAARTRHIFTFDAADAGSATLRITLDENEELILALTVEMNEKA